VIGAERVLWWTVTEWTAVGTIALVLVTAVYVVLTSRIVRHAHRSASAAERAASAAADSATAAAAQLEAAIVAVGRVPESHLERLIPLSVVWIGQAAYVHEVRLRWRAGSPFHRRAEPMHDLALTVQGRDLPHRVHRGDVLDCEWPESAIGASGEFQVDVAYSVGRESEHLRVRRMVSPPIEPK
jgi:hypothetical protein